MTGKKALGGIAASELLEEITQIVIDQQRESLDILQDIENEMADENIIFLNEKEVRPDQEQFLNNFFIEKVGPALVTVILHDQEQDLSDNKAFLVVTLTVDEQGESSPLYALIELPKQLDRFVVLPKEGDKQYVMLLDDLNRYNFHLIFNMFNYSSIEAPMLKITRYSELDLVEYVGKSYV